jgi:hypothetical protein
MKILISEKQFKSLNENEIKEKLGVPSGILESGEDLYNDIIDKIKSYHSIEELENGFDIESEYKVGDHIFKKIKVKFDFNVDPEEEPDLYGIATHKLSKLSQKFNLYHVNEKEEIELIFNFSIKPETTVEDIVNILVSNPEKTISTFTHELGHGYYDVKKRGEKSTSRAEYQAVSSNRFSNINLLNDFIFYSYYIHGIENVVRPSEMAQLLKLHGVSQKEFLKFFQKTEMYETLKKIQNFSYEYLREELKDEVDNIKDLFNTNNLDYEGMNDEQIIDRILELLYINMVNWKQDVMMKILTSNALESIFGFSGDKERFYEKYMNNAIRFQNNPLNFFKSETRKFNLVATKMIKKLAKLYDYINASQK